MNYELMDPCVHGMVKWQYRDCGSLRQSGPRPDPRLLRQAALEALTRSARTNTPRKTRPERFPANLAAAAGGGGRRTAAA
ncbi:hypothetical protein F511_16420 [Dorcoceras hygrometricum]|uniref:Uncharacterized protein n=1 Tax=Dorcoceras hygrometricum TaxID=472368 RepID=A0A2Z7AH02_9LAMI|nr:hypothetical protein F511_16420 [Dorcoceras hygrometricum]